MMFRIKTFLTCLLLMLCCLSLKAYAIDESDVKKQIVCGMTVKGEEKTCDTSHKKCIKCKATIPTPFLLTYVNAEVYTCVNKNMIKLPRCSDAPNGGKVGDVEIKFAAWNVAKKTGKECIVSNFAQKYAYCYACEVVETLFYAFITAAGHAYEVSRKAANAVLVVVTIIWLAFFVLKNVSSFATIEPMKMLQDLLIQLFKIFVAFTIINSGIKTILHYSLVPIMNAGTDFGSAIMMTAPVVKMPTTSASSSGGGS